MLWKFLPHPDPDPDLDLRSLTHTPIQGPTYMTYYSVQALTLISCPRHGVYPQWIEICLTNSFNGAMLIRRLESRQTRVFRITKEQVA